jgi:glyoxylase-like metal-dependent hydrolase (beta-lactamase superfamily II)
MKLGKFDIYVFVENRSYVDGGMMFGVVPKKLWEKQVKSNPDNLVAMDTNIFIIRTEDKTLMVDTGLGTMLNDRQKKMYGITTPSRMTEGLNDLGLTEDDIDYVIHTHLHLDHVGGAVKDDGSGKPVPRFANAEHIVQKMEWKAALNPDDRSLAAYDEDKFVPLNEAGQMRIIDGNIELLPGIKLVQTGAHSIGHQGLIVESGGERLYLFADIVPFSAHLRPAYVSSADLFPLDTIKIKKELIPEIVKNGWYLGFDHEIDMKIAKIIDDGKKFVAQKVI